MRVTHPYHPLHGRVFKLVRRGQVGRERRVWFQNDAGQLISLAESWTSLGAVDPFVALAKGRARTRISDLLELAQLVADLKGAAVKEIM